MRLPKMRAWRWLAGAWLVGCGDPEDSPKGDPSRPTGDRDGDGYLSPADCDDDDAGRSPGIAEVIGDGVDNDCDGVEPVPDGRIEGDAVDSGYGWSLAIAPGGLYVGAPFFSGEAGDAPNAGAVYRGGSRVATGAAGELLGLSLAVYGGGVVAGAPGERAGGEVREALSGAILLQSRGAGRRMVEAGGALWVAHAGGVIGIDPAGEVGRLATALPPDSVAAGSAGIAAGMRRGAAAISAPTGGVARIVPDELGAALLRGDADGDGREEWIAGAPGIGAVVLFDDGFVEQGRIIGPGGRFGHALALAEPGRLYVGAPLAGSEAQGAVYAIQGGSPVLLLSGESSEDQLGSSLIAGPGWLVAGAPGGAGAPGAVVGLRGL